ncbi:MAG: GGDEF domain-containing protein [Deltaproteobacteria bacterium]|nr:GGDEF domain-containing protein [Deltaproteobacteria bacterium]
MSIHKPTDGTTAKSKSGKAGESKPAASPPPATGAVSDDALRGPDPHKKIAARKQLTGSEQSTGEAFVSAQGTSLRAPSGPAAPVSTGSIGKGPFRGSLDERQDAFTKAARKEGVSSASAEKLWRIGPGWNARDPVTGFHGEADRVTTMQRATDTVTAKRGTAVYVQADIHNLSGLNQARGGPATNDHVRAVAGIFADELGKLGGQVTLFRGNGGRMSATVTGRDVTAAEVDGAMTHAQTRVAAYAREHGLDTIPHPLGRTPGLGLEARATQIRSKDTVDRLEKDTSLTTAAAVKPDHAVPRAEPLALAEASRPGTPDTAFRNAMEVQRDAFNAECTRNRLSPPRAQKLWDEHSVGNQDPVTGLLHGSFRAPTVQSAIDHVRANPADHGVYVEMDVANLGGLNRALGKQGADDVFRFASKTVQEELAPLGGSLSMIRHGGDEFSAVLVGPKATAENVQDALGRARTRISAYTNDHGLSDIPHAKHPDDERQRGTGVHFGVAQLTARDSPTTVFDAADARVVLDKMHGGH